MKNKDKMSEDKESIEVEDYRDIWPALEALMNTIHGPETQKERLKTLYKRCEKACDILDKIRNNISGHILKSYLDSRVLPNRPFCQ